MRDLIKVRINPEKGNEEKAIADFKKAITINSKYADAYEYLGFLCAQQNNYNDSIQYLTELIKIKPEYAPAYFNRASDYYKINDLKNARTDAEKACKLGAQNGCQLLDRLKK